MRLITCLAIAALPAGFALSGCTEELGGPATTEEREARRPITEPEDTEPGITPPGTTQPEESVPPGTNVPPQSGAPGQPQQPNPPANQPQ